VLNPEEGSLSPAVSPPTTAAPAAPPVVPSAPVAALPPAEMLTVSADLSCKVELSLLDRLKDMVITGGENVYSSEVEAVLHQHPAVAEAVIVAMPDERLGEIVTAVIVLKPGASSSGDEIATHCRKFLGGFKVPRRYQFVENLPKSALGKVLKGDIRKSYLRENHNA